ncbi:hypothetical protein NX059_007135 [Plenodomus lindquistii]|nr:hypothetical protein NX059_007135 [Plenodomus lindquistii]
MNQLLYTCNADAESLYRYRPGGYHPVHLGDNLGRGRYKILHQLGWGGYSTVWAARDQSNETYVAVKIAVSEGVEDNRELDTLTAIAAITTDEQDDHVMRMQGHFTTEGPNGTHSCIVLEMLGPSVADYLDSRFAGERLPANTAKTIAKQALRALCSLHDAGIAHGDLHIRNLAFAIPSMHDMSEQNFIDKLGVPRLGEVKRVDNAELGPRLPRYLVRAANYRIPKSMPPPAVKIIDYGQSFQRNSVPEVLHIPLCLRAPEIIFRDNVDYRMDLWSMGCMLFEFFVGQPPFDSIGTTPTILVRQMFQMTGDQVPQRWQKKWHDMDKASPGEESDYILQHWLEKTYFDGYRREDLRREDIVTLGGIIKSMLRLERSARLTARDVLKHPWFEEISYALTYSK